MLHEEIVLSPEELYYLARLCDGEAINYDYIAEMEDIEQNRNAYRDRCSENLSRLGFIEETWGEVSVSDQTREYFSPIWNGDYEARISVRKDGMESRIFLHFLKEDIRMVNFREDGLHIFQVLPEDVEALIYMLMPENYGQSTLPDERRVEKTEMDAAECRIGVSGCDIEKEMVVSGEFFKRDDRMYMLDESEDAVYLLSAEEFSGAVLDIIRGN